MELRDSPGQRPASRPAQDLPGPTGDGSGHLSAPTAGPSAVVAAIHGRTGAHAPSSAPVCLPTRHVGGSAGATPSPDEPLKAQASRPSPATPDLAGRPVVGGPP